MKKIFLLIALLYLNNFIHAQVVKADLLISNVNIIDVENNTIKAHQNIIILNDRIVEVGNNNNVTKYKIKNKIDATGKYIMPALWDMHVHFGGDSLKHENKMLLPLFVAMGVSTVRDCAGDISLDVLQWKKEINAGTLFGPSIYTSGPKLEGPNSIWPGDLEIADETALSKALDSLHTLKVDFIKITDNTLDPNLFLKSIVAARKRGWKVSGHAPIYNTINELSLSGLSTVEHIGYMTRAASADEEKITEARVRGKINNKEAGELYAQSYDSTIALQKFKKLAQQGTAVVPTINGSYVTTYLDSIQHDKDDYLKYIGPALKRTYNWRVQRAANDNAAAVQLRHKNFEANAALLRLIHKSGMTILAGTDAGYLNSYNYPGLGMHDELAILVKYGLTPSEALKASIINGPAFFNQSKHFGSVSKGKKADLLLLDENPLINISNTKKIQAVIKNGKYLNRKQLDAILSNIEAEVKLLETKN